MTANPYHCPGGFLLELRPDLETAVGEQGAGTAVYGAENGWIVGYPQLHGADKDRVIQHDRNNGGGPRFEGRIRRVETQVDLGGGGAGKNRQDQAGRQNKMIFNFCVHRSTYFMSVIFRTWL